MVRGGEPVKRLRKAHPGPSMKRILLHIGMPKCGSSFIQNSLHENRDTLATAGIGIPLTGYSSSYPKLGARHVRLSHSLELEGPHGPTAMVLRDEIDRSPCDTFIITHEGIAEDNDPTAVRAMLDGYEVTVVIYCRNPIDLIESRYRQWVLFDTYQSITRYAAQNAFVLDLTDTIREWRASFGASRVRIRSVDHTPDRQALATDIVVGAGIDAPTLVPTKAANERPRNAKILLRYVATLRRRMKLPDGPLVPGFDYGSNEGRLLSDTEAEALERRYGPTHLALLRAEGIADSYRSRDREKPWDAAYFDPAVRAAAAEWIERAAAAKQDTESAGPRDALKRVAQAFRRAFP